VIMLPNIKRLMIAFRLKIAQLDDSAQRTPPCKCSVG
jgi:hypothetical protein